MALHMKTDMLLLAKREIYIKLSKASFKITVHATATRATWDEEHSLINYVEAINMP